MLLTRSSWTSVPSTRQIRVQRIAVYSWQSLPFQMPQGCFKAEGSRQRRALIAKANSNDRQSKQADYQVQRSQLPDRLARGSSADSNGLDKAWRYISENSLSFRQKAGAAALGLALIAGKTTQECQITVDIALVLQNCILSYVHIPECNFCETCPMTVQGHPLLLMWQKLGHVFWATARWDPFSNLAQDC